MIRDILIENFKSIQSLNLELGRFNVLIGANGCGKSNILEAIAMGSAAAEDKLDNSSLINRGLRVTEPKLMKSGFKNEDLSSSIDIQFSYGQDIFKYILENDNTPFAKWKNKAGSYSEQFFNSWEKKTFNKERSAVNFELLLEESKNKFQEKINNKPFIGISDFSIYSPENYFLRRFEDEEKGSVLGLRGEGLFQMLQVIATNKPKQFEEIKEHLSVFDWFENAEIPNNLMSTEKRLKITDSYLQEGLKYFDQKSANEGFLYVLFYLTLFISDYTPKFFAIDNIDNALNPKLGSELMGILSKLAKKYDKQVIFTTHNPAILDGLNLHDPEQRLFVISRNAIGHTKALRIEKKSTAENGQSVKLSEQFLRGYIGGLNF